MAEPKGDDKDTHSHRYWEECISQTEIDHERLKSLGLPPYGRSSTVRRKHSFVLHLRDKFPALFGLFESSGRGADVDMVGSMRRSPEMEEFPDISRLDEVYGSLSLRSPYNWGPWKRPVPPKVRAVKRRLSSFALRRRNTSTVDPTRMSCDLREYLLRGQQ